MDLAKALASSGTTPVWEYIETGCKVGAEAAISTLAKGASQVA